MNCDAIISGGYVVDGTGSPGTYTNIAILNGKIAALGDLEWCDAKERIDAVAESQNAASSVNPTAARTAAITA